MSGKKELNEKQIFVRNLPFDVTSEDLTALFEDIGPLKNTSVAQTNGVGKGFGFVKFALESDANLAIEKLQGTLFHGRKLILELGLKKERVGRNKEANASAEDGETEEKEVEETTEPAKAAGKKEAKAKPVAAAAPAADHDGSVKKSRQVLIFGIPMDVTKKHFRAISTRGYKKTDVDLLKEDHELSAELHIVTPAGKIMLMTSPSRQEAVKVAAALNNATVHSLIVAHQNNHVIEVAKQELINKKKLAKVKEGAKPPLNAVPNNALDGLDLTKARKEKLYARTVAQITPLEQRKRKCRLIIRNLSYLATEQNVLDKMSKFGPIVSVELPKKAAPERVETGKTRKFPVKDRSEPKEHSMGFGFVTFLCEADAQYVVEKVTGLKVCNREVAVDFCMSKETYEKFGKKQDDTTEAGEEGSDGEKSDADEDEESQKDDKEEGSDADDASDAGSEDGSDADSQASQNLEEDDDEDSDANSDERSDKEEKEEEEVKPKAKKEPTEDVHEGCTVFVRGLPFDADSNDLKFALGKYGRISLALVVKDKTTDISKGSAFVKFLKPEFASACVTASQLAGGLSIKDRTCKIDLAVDRQSAQSIKDSEVAKRGKDKRNMYLANEGLIIPVTEGADEHNHGPTKSANMSEADKEKRQRAQSEKNKKLQNPLFFVSATRLSIRNLGKTVNDKELREICLNAAKNGIKKGLVKRADMEAYRAAQGSDFITAQLAALKGKTTDLDAVPPAVGKQCLKNAKIMLDMQRIRGGAPQSRGYAFCEFTHHAHALAALRELNNNAAYSSHHSNAANTGAADPNGGKLIVEFSLENIQKVKILKDREVRAKNRNGTSEAEEGGVTARQLKRQHKTEEFLQNGGVEGLANKAAAAASAAASAVKVEEAPVKKAFKPTKSYVVSPDTLPVVPPEGVNLKIFNKQLEKERQKKRKLEIKEHPELAEPKEKKVKVAKVAPAAVPAAPAVVAVTPVVPAAAKVEVKAVAKAAPAPVQASQPQQSQGKGQKRKQEETPVPAAAVAAPVAAAKKDKAPAHGEKKAAPAVPAAPAAAVAQPAKKAKVDTPAPAAAPVVSAPAAEKKEKVTFKDAKKNTQSPAKPSNNNNSSNNNGNAKFDNKNKGDKNHNNSNNNSTNADGTPQKKAWGGHKRLRAMKLKGGKK